LSLQPADPLPLVSVSLVFVLIVYVIRKRVPIGLALLGGGLLIGLLQAVPPLRIASDAWDIFQSSKTAEFVGIIGCVMAITTVLSRAGQIDRLTKAFRRCFSSARASVAVLPAVIGLLPMPGGALFSAPMVKSGSEGLTMKPEAKSAANYWFRHIFEYSWPLYPSMILAAQVTGLELKWLALGQAPLTLVAAVAGAWFILRRVRGEPVAREAGRFRAALDVFIVLLPIVVLITVHLATGWAVVWCVAIAMAFTILWHLAARNIGPAALLKGIFCSGEYLGMLVLGIGAKIFAEMMQRSGSIDGITAFFGALGLPVLLLVIVLPLVVGFFSGLNIVFVTTTYPILLGFGLPEDTAGRLPYFVLAFAAGGCGTILTPLHACFTLTIAYFKADLLGTLRRFAPAAVLTLAAAVGLFFLYSEVLL
jgi:integral membrane protein (TIGR00529 family)